MHFISLTVSACELWCSLLKCCRDDSSYILHDSHPHFEPFIVKGHAWRLATKYLGHSEIPHAYEILKILGSHHSISPLVHGNELVLKKSSNSDLKWHGTWQGWNMLKIVGLKICVSSRELFSETGISDATHSRNKQRLLLKWACYHRMGGQLVMDC